MPPTSPSYFSQQQQNKHSYNYANNPQHFHHPGAVSPPPMNYASMDNGQNGHSSTAFPPPPPPLSTTISNMQAATSSNSSTFRTNPKLTANAVPRPYPGSPVIGNNSSSLLTNATTTTSTTTNINNNNNGGSTFGAGRLSQPSSPMTPSNNYQQSFETTTISSNINNQQQSNQKLGINRNLEACVQDLHDKTFGQGGVVQITSSSTGQPGQNYEGYTSR